MGEGNGASDPAIPDCQLRKLAIDPVIGGGDHDIPKWAKNGLPLVLPRDSLDRHRGEGRYAMVNAAQAIELQNNTRG